MKGLSKREKFLLISSIITIISYLYCFHYLLFFLNKIRDLNIEIKELENQNCTQKSLETIQINFEIPQSEDSSKIISNIKKYADSLDLTLNRISFNTPFEIKDINYKNNIKKLKLYADKVQVILSGDYKNICSFIKYCEEDKRICEIKNLILIKSDKGFNAHLQIYYYFLSDNEAEKEGYSDYEIIYNE
ncbi:MAG: hypothetical protein N2448_09235 [Caloramator sp.]|nr:hypothetical protein [Caloramator sp.]